MERRMLVIAIMFCFIFQLAPEGAIADSGEYRREPTITTLGSYVLDIPDHSIECTLTYERHDYTQYIGSFSVECPMVYDLPILAGNLPGIDSINARFRQDLQRFEEEIYSEYGLPMYMQSDDEDMYFIATNKLKETVYCGEEEKTSGPQYFDGHYLCLLFDEVWGDYDRAWPRIRLLTYDLQTGESVSFLDLFGNITNIQAKLESELEHYLEFTIQEDRNTIRDIITRFKMVDLNELTYGISTDGMLFLYLEDDILDYRAYAPLILQTSISLNDALAATPRQEHEKKIIRQKRKYDDSAAEGTLTHQWNYDENGNLIADTEYGPDNRILRSVQYQYNDREDLVCQIKKYQNHTERSEMEYDRYGLITHSMEYKDDILQSEKRYSTEYSHHKVNYAAVYDADGLSHCYEYKWDDHGNTILEQYSNRDGFSYEKHYSYVYDESDRLLEEYEEDTLRNRWSYIFDDNGNLISSEKTTFPEDGGSYISESYSYYPDGTIRDKEEYNHSSYSGSTYHYKSTEYYANGHKKIETTWNSDMTAEIQKEYDQNENLLFWMDYGGKINMWYEYDSDGRLLHIRTENDYFINQTEDERYWNYGDQYFTYNYNGDLIEETSSNNSYTEYTYEYWGDDEEKDRNAAGIPIDEANFPDEEFRYYIRYCGIDTNEDGFLSDGEIAATDSIELVPNDNIIESLEGIECFYALTDLDVCAKNIEILDVSMLPHLHRLICDENGIRELILGNLSELVYLNCSCNQISTLDISGCKELVWLIENGVGNEYEGTVQYVVENYSSSLYGKQKLVYDADVRLITFASSESEEHKDPSYAGMVDGSVDYIDAYLSILKDFEYDILENENNITNDGNGSVAIVDFFGDETPELLFATYYEEWERPCTILYAYTMQDGTPKELDLTAAYYAPSFVSNGFMAEDGIIMWENMNVCLFTCEVNGEQCLSVYYSIGSDYFDELFTVFDRSGNDLQIAHQYAHSESEWTDNYGYINQVYVVDGMNSDAFDYGNETAKLMNTANKIVFAGYVTDGLRDVRQERLFVRDAIDMLVEYDPKSMIAIDAARFPDERFREILMTEAYDANGDGILSGKEIQAIDYLDVSGMGIESLEGIQYLTELQALNCGDNHIKRLDVSMLTQLYNINCSDNGMEELILGTAPTDDYFSLICTRNNIEELDISGIPYLCDIVENYSYDDTDYGTREYETGDPDIPYFYTFGHDSRTKIIIQ